ncbi:hypothetical protein QR98_0059170 [Sarcoptes scabiei]|uniref:Uncharacterized protein n=1 Tax=Sarcoptes scabiei TaxID=52283 RepID=A0A132A8X4_SARSC|nr:hypothetical protein QR98_0059170 [Sarcoptes scabiei]
MIVTDCSNDNRNQDNQENRNDSIENHFDDISSTSSDLKNIQANMMSQNIKDIFNYVSEFEQTNIKIKSELCKLKNEIVGSKNSKRKFQKLYDEQIGCCSDLEKEASTLIKAIKSNYELNINLMKKSYEEQFLTLIEKHKSELKKLSETDVDQSEKIDQIKQQFHKQIENLQIKIKDLNSASDKSLKEKDVLVKTLQEQLKNAETKNNEQIQQIKNLNSEIDKLKADISSSVANKTESVKESQEKQNSNENAESENQELKSKLAITNCDLRTLNKKLENKNEICNILRKELSEAKEKLLFYEKDLSDEKKKNLDSNELLSCYKAEINSSKMVLQEKNEEIMELTKSQEKWRAKAKELADKNEFLMKEIENCKRKNADLNYMIEKKANEFDEISNEKNRMTRINDKLKMLNKCLEQEIQQYAEKIPNFLNQQRLSTEDEIDSLQKQLLQMKNKNENLSIEIDLLNNQISDLKENQITMIEKEKIKLIRAEQELEIEKNKNLRLEDRLIHLEDIYLDKENRLQNNLNSKENELIAIKEEAANHITKISQLENENHELKLELESLKNEVQSSYDKIMNLQDDVHHKQAELSRSKIYYDETVTQHRKLIDYINSMHSEKKKSLFSFTNKSVSSDHAKKYEELEKEFRQEKQRNHFLNEKLNDVFLGFERSALEVEKLKAKLKKMEEQLKDKFADDFSKDFKYISNFEHNFATSIARSSNICVSCAKTIYFGQKVKKCQDCNATIHANCELFNNCGLSVQMVRKKSLGLSQDDDYDSYSQSSSIVNSEIEPTAPTDIYDSESDEYFKLDKESV